MVALVGHILARLVTMVRLRFSSPTMHSAGLSTGVRMRISVMGRILVHLVTFLNSFPHLVTFSYIWVSRWCDLGVMVWLASKLALIQISEELFRKYQILIWVQWLEWPENWFWSKAQKNYFPSSRYCSSSRSGQLSSKLIPDNALPDNEATAGNLKQKINWQSAHSICWWIIFRRTIAVFFAI